VCHEVVGKSIIVSCATQKIPIFRNVPSQSRPERGLEKHGTIAYLFGGAGRADRSAGARNLL
jgi:hypothetical protein